MSPSPNWFILSRKHKYIFNILIPHSNVFAKQPDEMSVMNKQFEVRLVPEEREQLDALAHNRYVAVHIRRQAGTPLPVNLREHGPGLAHQGAAERTGVCRTTVKRVRQRCMLEGLGATRGTRPLDAVATGRRDVTALDRALNLP